MRCAGLFSALLGWLLTTTTTTSGIASAGEVHAHTEVLTARQGTPATGIIQDFMVTEPVLTPASSGNDGSCVVTQTLMEYSFANSYNQPFVGAYVPPSNCDFNRVTINLTVTSQGRQFDRLAIMYLGDYEVWRTSTAEPTREGIIWTYAKEMQQYLSLWQKPQKLIFDLGNLVDSTYTAPFNTTLTATFFSVPDSPATADSIVAISKGLGSQGQASVFQIPDEQATVNATLPGTVERAIVSVSANGQIGEEFWYTNVFDEDADTFGVNNSLPAGGPWREVQVLIDGQLAGVTWSFPVIFTGGVVPGLWRPIVSIQTFDLEEHEVDITPWLGHLLDGNSHSFEIRVAAVGASDGSGGAAVAQTPTSYWLVSGKIFLFTNSQGKKTKATLPSVSGSGPNLRVTRDIKTQNGTNLTLTETTSAKRSLDVRAIVNGKNVYWTQDLSYSNTNIASNNAQVQNTTQNTRGNDVSSSGYSKQYNYPVTVNQAEQIFPNGSLSRIDGDVSLGQSTTQKGLSVFPDGTQPFNRTVFNSSSAHGAPLLVSNDGPSQQPLLKPASLSLPSLNGAVRNTMLKGTGTYLATTSGTSSQSYSFGTTSQKLSFAGIANEEGGKVVEIYERDVMAVNTTVTQDKSILLGQVVRNVEGPSPGRMNFALEQGSEFEVAVVSRKGDGGQMGLGSGRNKL